MRRIIAIALLLLLVTTASAVRTNVTVVARGDNVTFDVGHDPGSVWVFAFSGMDGLYDVNTTYHVNTTDVRYFASNTTDEINKTTYNETIYYFELQANQTASLDPGEYDLVLQKVGDNKIKEAFYSERYNVTSWTTDNPVIDKYIVSPFKSVKDININGFQAQMVEQVLYNMTAGSDDILIKTNMTVEEPLTAVREIDQINDDQIYIYGTSNLKVGTNVSILWDAERQVSSADYKKNTYYAVVQPGNATEGREQERWFGEKLNVTIQDLPPGNHWVEVTANGLVTRYKYTVGELYRNQTPPPMQKIRYLNDGVIVTPTPVTIEVPVEVTREVTVIQTVVIPTQPFPKNALGEEYDPTKTPDINITWMGLPAIGILVGLMIFRKALIK